DGDDAVGVAQQRVNVDLGDLGVLGDDAAKLHQHIDNAVYVRRRTVAITFEQRGDARALDLGACKSSIERRQLQRFVAQDLDRGTAVAEQDHGTERRVRG